MRLRGERRGNYKPGVEGISNIFPKGVYDKRERARLSEGRLIGWSIVPDKRAFHEC